MSFNEHDIVRDGAGRFDEKNHSAPEIGLVSGKAVPVARDMHAEALASLEHILEDQGQAPLTAARESMASFDWRPELYYIEQGDSLDRTLGAFIEGNDDDVDELLLHIDDNNFDNETRICEEMFAGSWDDLDEDAQAEVRQWLHDYDASDPIGDMIRQTGHQLMQVQIADDNDLDADLRAAAAFPEASQERYGAIEDALLKAVTAAGGSDTEANRDAVRTLIDENDLSSGTLHAEQWQLRVLVYDDISDYSRSAYSSIGNGDRDITLHDAHLVLIDPNSGRGMDAQLDGPVTARISADRPARLDGDLNYGSWDEIAGVHKPGYAPAFSRTRVLETESA